MSNLYPLFYDFWNELFFDMPSIGSNFLHSLTILSIFAILGFVLIFIYKLIKMFFGGSSWF